MNTMTKKPDKAKRNKPQRKGVAYTMWLPEELMDLVDRFVEESHPRTSKKALVIAAIEDFFRARNWPPKPKEPGQ